HPPIMIGGAGRRVLAYAAREADIVSVSTVPFVPYNEDGLTPQQEAARRFSYIETAAGTRIGDVDIESSPLFISITDSAAEADSIHERIAAKVGVAPDVVRDHPNVLIGSVGAITEALQERREAYGANYITVQQAQLGRFAPIVAALTGT